MFSGTFKKHLPWLAPALVAFITLVLFLPSLRNGFISWDDLENFSENRNYRGLGWENLKWMFTTFSMGPYAPLTSVTFGLDYVAWGMNPFGYHLTSVLLHAGNSLLVCLIFARLLAAARPFPPARDTDLYLSAGAAALFFSLHPLRVESAAWLSGRHDLLAGFFYLLAVLWYLGPRTEEGKTSSLWRRHLLPLAAFLLALLSKGIAITLPATLLLLDVYPLRRLPANPAAWLSRENRAVLVEKLPFFALAAAFGAIGFLCQAKVGALTSMQQSGFSARAAHILFSVFFYVKKTLVPSGLYPVYRLPADFALLSGQTLLAAAGITALTLAAAAAAARRKPAGLTAWLYYLAALSPVSGILKFSAPVADRYSYLPGLGFAALAGAGLWKGLRSENKNMKPACLLFAGLALAGLAALTLRQQQVWRSSEALWRHTLAVNPAIDAAHNNLGVLLAAQGKTEEAVSHYREALRLNPAMPTAYTNLGVVLAARGGYEEAARYYLEAVKIDPACYKAHNNLCGILPLQGKADLAVKHCLEALKIKPDATGLHNNLGIALATQGNIEQAVLEYTEELRLNPGFAEAHYNLGHELAAQGKAGPAIEHYTEAVRLNPAMAKAYYNLGVLLAAQGKPAEAVRYYKEAVRADPALAVAHNNIAITLNQLGRREEAAAHFQAALKINPDYAEVYYNLGLDLVRHGKNEEAAKHFRRAREINPNIGK